MGIENSSRGARQLGWASCLTSAGRVTLAGGTTFSHIDTLGRLPGTTHSVSNVTYNVHILDFKAEIYIEEIKF